MKYRSAVAEQESDVLEPPVEGEGEVAGLLHCPLAGGVGGDAPEVHPAGAMLDEHQDMESFQQHGVHVQEVNRKDPAGLAGFLNSVTGVELGFYAARSYSLMRPPRTGRRLIRSWERSAGGWSGCGGCSWRLRWGRRPL